MEKFLKRNFYRSILPTCELEDIPSPSLRISNKKI